MAKPVDSLSLERRVDALFAKYTLPGSPGAVVAVTRAGHLELCKGYGLASIEHGVPITPRTRFRIASVSKQFTVTAALMLAAEGKLDLAAPPHRYLRALKPLPVTIDQMMRNSSGLPDFLELMRLGGHGLDRPARAADLFTACVLNRHLNFRPGSRFSSAAALALVARTSATAFRQIGNAVPPLMAAAIAGARRPVLLVGHGVAIARAEAAVMELARKALIPITWTLLGIALYIVTLVVVRRVPDLARYKWTLLLLGHFMPPHRHNVQATCR